MVTVLLAHESRLVRQALAKILSIQDGISVVGHATTGPDTEKKIEQLRPDVLVVNSSLPRLNGVLPNDRPESSMDVMVVTPATQPGKHDDTSYIGQDDTLGDLVGAVIHAGGEESRMAHFDSKDRSLEGLTSREQQILKLVADGLSNRQISCDMEITERTVKYHISNILRKLDLFSRTEAAILFLKGEFASAR